MGNAIGREFDMGTSGSAIWWSWWRLRRILGWHWAASGMIWSGREVWRFASGSEPSQSQLRWWRNLMGNGGGWLLSGEKKIIIFYNMKCKDVLDKKLRVADENEIAWHESRWIVRLLSIAIAAWWENNYFFIIWNVLRWEDFGSEDLLGCFIGSRDLIHYGECCQQDGMKTWFLDGSWGGNLKFHDMGIARVDMNWDGIGRKWRWRRWMLSDRKVEMGF